MSTYLIALVMLIYAWVAADQYMAGNTGMAIAFTGYAFSNAGLIMMAGK